MCLRDSWRLRYDLAGGTSARPGHRYGRRLRDRHGCAARHSGGWQTVAIEAIPFRSSQFILIVRTTSMRPSSPMSCINRYFCELRILSLNEDMTLEEVGSRQASFTNTACCVSAAWHNITKPDVTNHTTTKKREGNFDMQNVDMSITFRTSVLSERHRRSQSLHNYC
jgi:hypothetical protein